MAEDRIKTKLEEVILKDLEKYENMDSCSDKIAEAKATATLIETHFKNAAEVEKAKAEKYAAIAKYVEIGVGVAEFSISMLIYMKLYHEGLDLEINGTYTIQTFKNLAFDTMKRLSNRVK